MRKIILVLLLLYTTKLFSQDLSVAYDFFNTQSSIVLDHMEIVNDPEVLEINEKIGKALQSQQDWFKEYLNENINVRPLPYHNNMGVTEEEYQLFLNLSQSGTLQKINEASIKITHTNDSLCIEFLGDYSFLGIIEILKSSNIVQTKYGIYKADERVNNDDSKSLTGRWEGDKWTLNSIKNVNDPKGIFSDFVFGIKDNNETIIIKYEVKNFMPGNEHRFDFLFYYNLS